MIVKVIGVPGHPLAVGVTVIVETTVEVVGFVATKEAISPLPLATKPMEVLLFIQLNVVPVT